MNKMLLHLTFAYSFQQNFISSIIAPAWTLSAEIQFYLLLPFLALFFIKRHIGWLLGAICLSAAFQYCSPFPPTKTVLIANWPYTSLAFLLGMLAAWLVRNHPRICAPLAIPGIIGFVLVRLLTLWLPYGNSTLSLILDPPRQLAPSFFALLAICGLSTGKDTITKLLSCRLIRFFGIIGYSIFLLHFPIIWSLQKTTSPLISLIVSPLLVIVTSVLSYQYVEVPFIRLAHRHFNPPPTSIRNLPGFAPSTRDN